MKIALHTSALIAVAFLSNSASAAEVWTSKDGKSALELNAFHKSYVTALRMRAGLVDGTKALQTLIDGVRNDLPPEQAKLVPSIRSIPPFGAQSTHTSRIWGRFLLGEQFEFSAAWQLGAVLASDAALIGGGAPGNSVPVSAFRVTSRRLVDFDPVLAEQGGFVLLHNLDRLAVKWHSNFADVTVGRQVLSWGSGRFWNPTDLLSPFGPADIDREVRRGVDAVRVSLPLAETMQVEVLWLPQQEARNNGGVVRSQFNLRGFDIAPSVAKYLRDAVFGLDVSGDIGPVGVHGEIAATSALDVGTNGKHERYVRAVVGADIRPRESLVLTGEYYFNGFGAKDPLGYLGVLRSNRVTRGEVFGAGRHYLGVAAAWQATELLSVQASAITNLQDPSVLLVPALEYWMEQSVLVRFGGFVPIGRSADTSELQRLTRSDLLTQNTAWLTATTGFGLRSEYGVSPFGLFAQIVLRLL